MFPRLCREFCFIPPAAFRFNSNYANRIDNQNLKPFKLKDIVFKIQQRRIDPEHLVCRYCDTSKSYSSNNECGDACGCAVKLRQALNNFLNAMASLAMACATQTLSVNGEPGRMAKRDGLPLRDESHG